MRSSLILLALLPVLSERQVALMGTEVRGLVEAPTRAEGLARLEEAFVEMARVEALLSTWRADSELALLNAAPAGSPRDVSPELGQLLKRTLGLARASEGAFDPTVGALIAAWDMRGRGRRPDEAELATARAATGPWLVERREGGAMVRFDERVRLEEGGFGKGHALACAARLLRARGVTRALVDAGGQLLAIGGPWEVDVAHPSLRQRPVASLAIGDASASTSSQSERFVDVAGVRHGHVIDPRSGWPVAAGGSATVVAADPLLADVYSTALLVMGPEHGMAWIQAQEGAAAALFIREERGRLRGSATRGMDALLAWIDVPCDVLP